LALTPALQCGSTPVVCAAMRCVYCIGRDCCQACKPKVVTLDPESSDSEEDNEEDNYSDRSDCMSIMSEYYYRSD
jgi:hypothetical protein